MGEEGLRMVIFDFTEIACPTHGIPALLALMAPYWNEFYSYAKTWAVRIFMWGRVVGR